MASSHGAGLQPQRRGRIRRRALVARLAGAYASDMLRTALIAVVLVGAAIGCSADLHTPPHIVCHDRDGCPTDSALRGALWTFHDVAATAFDPEEDLVGHWYPADTVFLSTDTGLVVGYTESPRVVHATSVPVLVHEVMHVHLWRMFPEYAGDADHEAGSGPWTEATNEAVREVVAVLENAEETDP